MSRETLGEFEQVVLLAILQLNGDVYGVPIVDEIQRRTRRDLAEVFARDCRALGASRARRRYWRHVMSFSAHFLLDDLRERGRPRISWMDLKLSLRMLVKYPGLTTVG